MSSSAAKFAGSVPGFYDRHLGPVLFEPYAADLLSRLPTADGLRVLEIACGTGIVTRRLREALPDSALVVATDLNEPMIAYAREAVPAPGIVWQQADAQALPFDGGSFNVVVCQFGFMFLPDKVEGFREARRVLSTDGVLHLFFAGPAVTSHEFFDFCRRVTRDFDSTFRGSQQRTSTRAP